MNEDGNGNWPEQSVELEINKPDDVIKKELKHAAKVLTNSVQVTPVQTKVGGLDDRNLKNLIDITRYSSFDKLLVVTSYVLRFISNLMATTGEKDGCNYVR